MTETGTRRQIYPLYVYFVCSSKNKKKTHTELPAEKGKAVDLNEITQACSLADIVAEHSVADVQ